MAVNKALAKFKRRFASEHHRAPTKEEQTEFLRSLTNRRNLSKRGKSTCTRSYHGAHGSH